MCTSFHGREQRPLQKLEAETEVFLFEKKKNAYLSAFSVDGFRQLEHKRCGIRVTLSRTTDLCWYAY